MNLHWHKWARWSEPKLNTLYVFQFRTCSVCNKIQRREVK